MAWSSTDRARRHGDAERKNVERRLDQVVTCECAGCGRRKTGRLRLMRQWFAEHRRACG